MTAVQIAQMAAAGISARGVVRTSGGTLYAVFVYSSYVRVYKSTDGTSWGSELDSSNHPASVYPLSCCIDGGSPQLLHIVNYQSGSILGYATFNTSTDAYVTKETCQSISTATGRIWACGITIDSNNKPHVVYTDMPANMGTDYNTVYYTNKTGASWSTKLEIEGKTAQKQCTHGDITISASNDIIMSYINRTDADLGAAKLVSPYGSGNLTIQKVDTSVAAADTNLTTSLAIDSSDNEHIAYVDSGNYLCVAHHHRASGWTSWETKETVSAQTNSTACPSIAIDGANRYIFIKKTDVTDICYFKDTGAGWDSGTVIDVGTYNYPKARWSYYNNPSYTTYGIDYVFDDGSYEYWNTLPTALGPANLSTINGLTKASISKVNNLAIASVKSWNGLA